MLQSVRPSNVCQDFVSLDGQRTSATMLTSAGQLNARSEGGVPETSPTTDPAPRPSTSTKQAEIRWRILKWLWWACGA